MPDPVLTGPASGGTLVRTPEEAALLGESFGTPTVSPEAAFAGQRAERRRRMFDNPEDKLTTFAEGAIDAFTLGLIHETGDAAEIRREVNSGYALAGNILGTVAGLSIGGPVKWAAGTGEAAGRTAARVILGRETGAIAAGLTEAGAGAALMTATAAGHQVLDAVIEDKPFAAEAIVDAAKLGGVMGFAGGAAFGGLKAFRASRAAVEGQGGFLAAVGDEAPAVARYSEAIRAYDASIESNARVLGALKEFRKAGKLGEVSDDFIRVRSAALREAEAAQANLRAIDESVALGGADVSAFKAWSRARERYVGAVRDLDEIIGPHPAELDAIAGDFEATAVRPREEALQGVAPAAVKPKGFANEADYAAYEAAHPSMALDSDASSVRAPAGGATAGARPGNLADLDAALEGVPVRAEANGRMFADNLDRRGAAKTVKEDLPAGAAVGAIDRAAQAAPTEQYVNAPAAAARRAQAQMDEWAAMAQPRVRPFDEAAAKVREAMESLYKASGSRMDSASGLDLLAKAGIRPSTDPMGPYMDQVWAMRRAGRLAADAGRGVKNEMTKGLLSDLAAIGAAGAGHPAVALGMKLIGLSGKLSSTAGTLAIRAAGAVEKFMTSTKLRAATVAAGNHAWVYSDRGPIEDPLERIQEVKFLATNPDAIKERVAQSMGDLGFVSPDLVTAMQNCVQGKITAVAMRAPAIFWDKLGRPLSPPAGQMRDFFEFENAMHDLPGLLKGVEAGSCTKAQIAALQQGWPSVHLKIAAGFLADPERLRTLNRARLRIVEAITGAPLTNATDPLFLLRQTQAWIPPEPAQPPGRPQAFNINPEGAPTPTQTNSGRAPGN